MKTPRLLTFLTLISLLGVALAISLSQEYYDVRSGLASFKSFCNISSAMNCDRVAASPYAEFIAGFPLSSFVAGWYTALVIISLLARDRFWRRDSLRVAFFMSLFSCVTGGLYLGIMMTKLHTYCLFCLGVDGVNVIALLTLLGLRSEWKSANPVDRSKWTKMAGIITACVLVSVMGLKTLDANPASANEINQLVATSLSEAPLPLNISDSDPSIGPVGAPITIVEFSDFQCPYCKVAAKLMKTITNRYPTQVRVIFRPFPWDISCNRLLTHPMHSAACEAARVGLCANKLGMFEPVYENIFEHQTDIAPGTSAKMATDAGASASALETCTASPDTAAELSKGIEEAIQLGVQSTPTFFINGRKVEGAYPIPFWTQIIDKMLQKN